MYLWVILASILVALLRGGRIGRLRTLPFRMGGLVVLAFLLRAALGQAANFDLSLPDAVVWLVQAASYGLLLAAVIINRQVAGVPTLGVGVLANAVAILANGGRMPVSPAAAAAMGQQAAFERLAAGGGSYLHQAMADDTRFSFLSDILPSPSWLSGSHVYSIGDLFILVGLFILVQHVMLRSPAVPADRPGAGVS
ncbi:MAG TPA: DUF5317 domain-containing protein [Bacillota bacterium]